MPGKNGEAIKTHEGDPHLGPKGIKNNNESLAREDETQMNAAVRQGAIAKIEEKLKGANPEWPDDQVKAVATRMFEMATTGKPTGKASNEGNEDERGPENEMGKGAGPGEYYESSGSQGMKGAS